jgi:hypothetical protein
MKFYAGRPKSFHEELKQTAIKVPQKAVLKNKIALRFN